MEPKPRRPVRTPLSNTSKPENKTTKSSEVSDWMFEFRDGKTKPKEEKKEKP